jgi:hypothetical protein
VKGAVAVAFDVAVESGFEFVAAACFLFLGVGIELVLIR